MNNQSDQASKVEIAVVFDNVGYFPQLETEWGFSCVIQTDSDTLLFDTGNNGKILLNNLSKLKINPNSIKFVIISHNHWDHTGGLTEFLSINPDVCVLIPNSSPATLEKEITQKGAKAMRVKSLETIVTNIYSMGELGESIPEQSLAIRTSKGLVIITGCAHPGIVNIVKQACSLFPDEPIYLALGGFHLKSIPQQEAEQIANSLKNLGVQHIAPSHCTGANAMGVFKQIYQNNYFDSGVGRKFEIRTEK